MRRELGTATVADAQLLLVVLLCGTVDAVVHRGVDVGGGADVGRHRQDQLGGRTPAALVALERAGLLLAVTDHLVVGADADQLRGELAPDALRVHQRQVLEVEPERLRQPLRHGALEAGPVGVGERPQLLLALAERLLPRLQELAVRALGIEEREGIVLAEALLREQLVHLLDRRERVVVAGRRVAGEPPTLDRVRDDERGVDRIELRAPEGVEHDRDVVTAQIGEDRVDLVVGVARERALDPLVEADQALATDAAVLLEQHHLELEVGERVLEEVAQAIAVDLLEGRQPLAAVATLDHVPAIGHRDALDAVGIGAAEPALVGDAGTVQVLSVVVDDPGDVAELALRGVRHRLHQGALAELGVAHQRPEVRVLGQLDVVVLAVLEGQRHVHRDHRRDADRAGGEVDVPVGVPLRVIALEDRLTVLRELAKPGHRALGLVDVQPAAAARLVEEAEQVVERVIDRGAVRLHRDPVLRLAHAQVERRHDVDARGARRRVAADLRVALHHVVAMIRVDDHLRGEHKDPVGNALDQLDLFLDPDHDRRSLSTPAEPGPAQRTPIHENARLLAGGTVTQ